MKDLDVIEPQTIPGYEFGSSNISLSPVSRLDLEQLEQTVGWTGSDALLLRQHAELFRQNAEKMVDAWRSVIAAQPHLAQWFAGPDGSPDKEYKARVKQRFVQWVMDVALRPHDADWLNYQEEIGRRHTPAKKNRTDEAHTPPLVPLRYVLAFLPVVLPIRSFFSAALPDDAELTKIELTKIEQAWTKAVLLHITLWTRPYTLDGFW